MAQRHKARDKGWLKRQQSRLKKGRWKQVLKELESMEEAASVPDELAVARNARRYLANRTDQLWYDEALKLEKNIGSGLNLKRKMGVRGECRLGGGLPGAGWGCPCEPFSTR
ncbi:MAG: hypothetical protein LBC18_13120 [Opitutaceae bacterium]|nr:hypothetical protein [Opitutaceae bacterium]